MQTTGRKRNTIDKFYTKIEVANHCIKLFRKYVQINKTDLIIEPAAGNGAFFGLERLGCKTEFYDVYPEHTDIVEKDFFNYVAPKSNKIHVVTNPPFGKQSCLAKAFISHAAKFADTIAFILPKSFKKINMQRAFPLNFHLVIQEDLPENSFVIFQGNNSFVKDIEHDVPCVFQIWVKRDYEREIPDKLEPDGYQFVKREALPDVAIRRVGVNAGHVTTDSSNLCETSHYFLKFDQFGQDVISRLQNIKFPFDNTVGPKSISKQELIKEINFS